MTAADGAVGIRARRGMDLEKLDRKDLRLIVVCAVVAVVSLFVGVRYFFKAFPEAQIEFKTTKKSSLPIARTFLAGLDLPTTGYRHASIFGFDDDAKTFLERELGAEESGKLLDGPIRMWRWRHRWFRPSQKEELQVDVTTKGEVASFRHLLDEDQAGASLTAAEARTVAETFLTDVMHRRLEDLAFVEGSVLKRPHRTDHDFTWKMKDLQVHGADYRITVGVAGDRASAYEEWLNLPDAWKEAYKKLRSKNTTAGVVDTGFLMLTVVAMLVLLVVCLRRGDVKWYPAGVIGAISFFLALLSPAQQPPRGPLPLRYEAVASRLPPADALPDGRGEPVHRRRRASHHRLRRAALPRPLPAPAVAVLPRSIRGRCGCARPSWPSSSGSP